jgi:23S rRNA-/tRNA-specific pseudouridylate synthase
LNLTILLETFDLLAINKPAGLAVHDAPGPGQSVLRWLQENGQHKNLTPVHRLDKDASGVLLFAKSKAVVTTLTHAWPNAQKFYTALCSGIPQRDSGTVVAPILEHQTGKPERLASAVKWFKEQNPHVDLPPLPPPKTSAVHPAGRVSQTDYRVLEKFTFSGSDTNSSGRFSLLEVRPKQGRMHQIRVHLTHLDCPFMRQN